MASEAVPQLPEMTGATLVMFEPGQKPKEIERVISNAVGVRTVHSSDFKSGDAAIAEAIDAEPAFSLDKLGIAVIAVRRRGRRRIGGGQPSPRPRACAPRGPSSGCRRSTNGTIVMPPGRGKA